MQRSIAITEVTKMKSGRVCVAGYYKDENALHCVRPEFAGKLRIDELDLSPAGRIVAPFTVVTCELETPRTVAPHTEDRLIRRWAVEGLPLDESARVALLTRTSWPSVAEVFHGHLKRTHSGTASVAVGSSCPSLGTVRVTAPRVAFWRARNDAGQTSWKYRLRFEDAGGDRYDLSLTDLAARRYLQHQVEVGSLEALVVAERLNDQLEAARELFLRVGLSRPFPDSSDCWLQVNAIHAFPDYLGGRNHADLAAWER